jgi:hypothetical protein
MVLKLGHFGKQNINIWTLLKCGTGERQGRSFGYDCVRNEDVT